MHAIATKAQTARSRRSGSSLTLPRWRCAAGHPVRLVRAHHRASARGGAAARLCPSRLSAGRATSALSFSLARMLPVHLRACLGDAHGQWKGPLPRPAAHAGLKDGAAAGQALVGELLTRCSEAGDIYKANYEGYYCVDCEEYKVALQRPTQFPLAAAPPRVRSPATRCTLGDACSRFHAFPYARS